VATTASSDTLEVLVLDLLEWISVAPRPYTDVLDAWRTSCPRLAVWEEATRRGLVVHRREDGVRLVALSTAGAQHLARVRNSTSG
jgi:D-3-phosphoglycerate dehydrogenase